MTYTALHEASHQIPLWLLGVEYQGYVRGNNPFNRHLIEHGWFDEAPRAAWVEYRDARGALSGWDGPKTRDYWRLKQTVLHFRCRGWVSWQNKAMQSATTGFCAFARVMTCYMPYIVASLLLAVCVHLGIDIIRRWRRESCESPMRLRVFYFLLPVMSYWMYVFYRTAIRVSDGLLENDIQMSSYWLKGYSLFGHALDTNDVLRQCTSGFVIFIGSIVVYVIAIQVAILALQLGLFGVPQAVVALASKRGQPCAVPVTVSPSEAAPM